MLPTKIKHLLCLLDSSHTTSSNKPPCCQPFPRIPKFAFRLRNLCNWHKLKLARIWGVSKTHLFLSLSMNFSEPKRKAKKNMEEEFGDFTRSEGECMDWQRLLWYSHQHKLAIQFQSTKVWIQRMRSRHCVNYVINWSCCSLPKYPHIQIQGLWVLLHRHQAYHICRSWVPLHWHQAYHNVQMRGSVALITTNPQIMNSVKLTSSMHWPLAIVHVQTLLGFFSKNKTLPSFALRLYWQWNDQLPEPHELPSLWQGRCWRQSLSYQRLSQTWQPYDLSLLNPPLQNACLVHPSGNASWGYKP